MNYYTVDILTPKKVVARNVPAESLLVPSEKGQINVLKGHTHVVTKLQTGLISIFGGADDSDRYFSVTTGVAKILNDKVVILADVSEECDAIDLERAKAALQNAERVLEKVETLSVEQIEKYRRKADRARLRIQLAGYSK
jgi:F-type H+-transporting ATPase subunit epsilon